MRCGPLIFTASSAPDRQCILASYSPNSTHLHHTYRPDLITCPIAVNLPYTEYVCRLKSSILLLCCHPSPCQPGHDLSRYVKVALHACPVFHLHLIASVSGSFYHVSRRYQHYMRSNMGGCCTRPANHGADIRTGCQPSRSIRNRVESRNVCRPLASSSTRAIG